jgi:diguanylate cyclase (GGDEF)-like protein
MRERGERRSRDRRWLRVAATAEILEVSEHTVRRWADTGVLPCRRSPSGQRQFRRSDLTRFLEACADSGRDGGSAEGVAGVTSDFEERDRILLELGRDVTRTADPFEVLEPLAARVASALGVERCVVCEHDPAFDTLVSLTGPDEMTLPLAERPELRAALASRTPLREPARLTVPFGLGASPSGCLVLQGSAVGRLSDDEVDLARDFGGLAAFAVHRRQTVRLQAEQEAHVQSLLHAGRSITSRLVLQEVLDTVAREVVGTFGAGYCIIWEYAEDEDVLVERAGFGFTDDYTVEGTVVRLDERPREREILFSPEPVIETLSDPSLDAQSRESMERWGEKTCLSVPLRFGDLTLGLLVVCETERERRFTAVELEVARGLANQASAAVRNARIFRDLQKRNLELEERARREKLLNELSLELSSSLDPRTVLDSACARISALLDASGCEMWTQCSDTDVECLAAWIDGEVLEDWRGRRYPLSYWAATRLVMERGETVAIESLDDPRLGAAEREIMVEWDQRALLATPLRARGRILGTLEITQSGRERVFTADEVATAEACARMTALAVDNAMLYERQGEHAQRLTSLLEAGRAITSSLDIQKVLSALVRTAAASLGCPEALIFEYDPEADTMTMRSVYQEHPTVYEDMDKPYPLAEYPSDRALLDAGDLVVETISDPALPDDVRESMERHGEKTCLTVPLRFGGKRIGMLTLVETAAERVFSEADLEFARGFAEQAAMAMHNAQLFEDVKGLHVGNLRALSSALTAKDLYTIGHTARVAAYAVLLAAELDWTPRAIQQLEEATYLHDIGKIAVADRVLLKSGGLTDEEWALMKQHPTVSAEIIESLLDDEYVAGVRFHHERWDGGGYPDGLSGEQIPLIARLLCLVDSYDAMSSRRVYRPALTYKECVIELRACSGKQFDPGLVEAFISVLERMAAQRDTLQVAANEAAARIDAGDHMVLRQPDDAARAEYARVLRALRETRLAHSEVQAMLTEAPVDELRCMVVVDDDDDDTAIPTGEVIFCADIEHETFAGRRNEANVVSVDRWGTWISAAAPIRADDGSVVGLVAASRTPGEGLPAGVLGSAVSDTFSEIMHTAGARQTRAEIESMTDALTGLYNHRRFHELLRETVDGARSVDGTVAVLFCDIDRFKQLNDRHGHLVGDDVLRRVSRILSTSVRRGDVAARYGGDEFGVLLHGADMETALEVAERIRERVAELWVGRGDAATTISIGVAALAGHVDYKELLASADEALYAAKEGGRNRVVRADTLQAAPPRLAPQL